jgi:hypothetical protein
MFEKVYAVWEIYDGPRTGLANFRGTPHAFSCEWSESDQYFAGTYTLSPISEETLALGLEQWEIFRRWEAAFHSGKVPPQTSLDGI